MCSVYLSRRRVPGTQVTINGSGYTPSSIANFGSTPTSVSFVSSTQVTAIAPPGCGSVGVTVTESGYTSPLALTNDTFTYGATTVTGVSPASGTALGGTSVNITGANYCPGATASFGANPASNVQYVSSGLLTATSPAGSGTVDVTVTAGGVTSATNPSDHFTYIPVPVPTVTRVTPNAAPAGTVVSIQGTNYMPGATVSFGAHPSTGVRFVSPTQLLAVAPSAGGTVDSPGDRQLRDESGNLCRPFHLPTPDRDTRVS